MIASMLPSYFFLSFANNKALEIVHTGRKLPNGGFFHVRHFQFRDIAKLWLHKPLKKEKFPVQKTIYTSREFS
jgi:hypothetical protein